MATSSAPETMDPAPYTPAGDIETVLTDLEGIDVERTDGSEADDADDSDEDESLLVAIDDALVELAATIDDPEPTETTDAADTTDGTGSADATAPHDESVLRRQRADFEAVAESTDVDFVPYDDAATFLASDLYTVPPANTRFQWVDDDALAAD